MHDHLARGIDERGPQPESEEVRAVVGEHQASASLDVEGHRGRLAVDGDARLPHESADPREVVIEVDAIPRVQLRAGWRGLVQRRRRGHGRVVIVRRVLTVVGIVDEHRGPLGDVVPDDQVGLEGELVLRVCEVPTLDIVVVLRGHRDRGAGDVPVAEELDVPDRAPVGVIDGDAVPGDLQGLVLRVDRQVERERDAVQLSVADGRVVRDPGVGQVCRRHREVHVRHALDGLIRRTGQGPRRVQGQSLHGDVPGERDGEDMVEARQVESFRGVELPEFDEAREALREDRVHRDPASRQVIAAGVDDVGPAEEPLVLSEDHDVIRMGGRPIPDAEQGVACLHSDEIPAAEPVRADRPDDDGGQVARRAGARRPHDSQGDEHHRGHDECHHQSPHRVHHSFVRAL